MNSEISEFIDKNTILPSYHSRFSYSSSHILFMGFSRQEFWSGLPFPSPVDNVLSELSTMTHPSWVAIRGMAHSFIELDKAVVHMIILISFPLLWFSFCLPSDGQEAYEEAELN